MSEGSMSNQECKKDEFQYDFCKKIMKKKELFAVCYHTKLAYQKACDFEKLKIGEYSQCCYDDKCIELFKCKK